MKLAHRYGLLFLVVVVVSGGVLLATFDAHRSDVTANAETSVEDRATSMATYLDKELAEQQRVVEFATTNEAIVDHRSEAQRSALKSFVETTAFDGVSVVDERGEVQSLVTDEGEHSEIVGKDLSSRHYVQRALAGEQYISDPFRAETDNHIVTISAPLVVDGETVGTLNGAYHLEETEIFDTVISEDGTTAVTVESGDIELYSTADRFDESITASAELETVSWTVQAHHDQRAVDSSVQQLASFQALLGLILLGTLLTFGGWVYRAQILQISRILDYLNALKRREYDSGCELGGGNEWEQIENTLTELREALSKREQMLLVHNRILRHNLRNKLNVIQSQAELLDSSVEEETRKETSEIQKTTEKLLHLADRARTTERLLNPPSDAETGTDVATVVHERAEAIQEREPALSITVSAPQAVYATCGEEISTAIDELLQNIADHAGTEPTATVTVAAAGDRVVIRIEDDGDGIPEKEAAVIAGDHDITQLQHTLGIGLWLVDWIVARYDGTLRVPQTAESGCVIEIELPRAAADEYSRIHGDE